MSTAYKLAQPPIPTPDELVARARALIPSLATRAQATEDNRSVLPEAIAAFEAAGFYRILQPAAYGGYEMRPEVLFHVAMELAKGCPSSAWCLCLVAVHNWEPGLMNPQMAHDLWAVDDGVRASSSYAAFGKVEAVPGGYRIAGRWPWSSGCDHCQWVILGGAVPGAAPDARAFFIPRSDYRIDDTWHVIGLKGTGSKDIVVEDAFVPEHRTHRFALSFLRQDEGLSTFTAPTYRYPFGIVFAYCLASVTVGMAEGALDSFLDQMQVRRSVYDGSKAAEDPLVRQRLAEAGAIVRALRLRFDAVFAEMAAVIDDGGQPSLESRVAYKWEAAAIAKDAARAVDLLFKATGGRGIRLENPIQRYFRDIHAASNHAFLNADRGALNAGAVLMGAQTMDVAL
ncbi:acyl-CoA dehydrogenase family protein [Zavarzinia sp. CC-PAN008]|uniref:acyl-CoA dehydrogenase family protein n=1 Tax=Zavarzinia sp. CC-PAN008 TaxID=3243332 RepID=UPI003F74A519